MERKFGFFTEALDFECGDIKTSTLPEIEEIKKNLTNNYNVHKDILYSPKSQLVTIKENLLDNITEETTVQLPYNSYIFPLPDTHMITSKKIEDEEYIDFLVWVLSFFIGVRLTTVATNIGNLQL